MAPDHETSYSTDAIRYTIRATESLRPDHRSMRLTERCLVAQVTICSPRRARVCIRCPNSTAHEPDYEARLAKELQREYLPRAIPTSSATRVAESVMLVIRSATGAHQCKGKTLLEVCVHVTEFLVDETPVERALRMCLEEAATSAAARSVARIIEDYLLLRA